MGDYALKTVARIFTEYRKWRTNWDDLCNKCGKCCYLRSRSPSGEVVVDYTSPCEFFVKESNLCSVFKNRFQKCNHCSSVNLMCALFHPMLPQDCAYFKTFRLWKKPKQ